MIHARYRKASSDDAGKNPNLQRGWIRHGDCPKRYQVGDPSLLAVCLKGKYVEFLKFNTINPLNNARTAFKSYIKRNIGVINADTSLISFP